MPVPLKCVRSWVVDVPLQTEWASSPEFGEHGHGKESSERLIIQICDEDGFEGWGEGNVALSPEGREAVFQRLLKESKNGLRLDLLPLFEPGGNYWLRPKPPSPYTPPLDNLRHRLRHPLQPVLEAALSDLIARRAGLPLCQLWGGPWRDSVAVDYWMGRVTPEHAGTCVKRALELGFTGVKLKTTLEDPNVERMEAIKAAGGEDFHVTVDPNGRFYRLEDALPTLRAMDAVGNMTILEDPFPRFHLQDFVALRPQISARLAVHIDPPETLWSVLTSGAAGALNINHASQGPGEWRRDAAVADRANIAIWHGSGLELGIGTALQLHLAASAPNCILPGDQAGPWLRETSLVKTAFQVEGGRVALPTGSGLGLEVDQDALENHGIGHWLAIEK